MRQTGLNRKSIVFKEAHTPSRSNEKRVENTQPAAFVPRKRTFSFRVRCATTELNEIADEGGKSVRKDGFFHSSCSREESGTFLAIQIKVNLRSNKRKNHFGSKLFKPSSNRTNVFAWTSRRRNARQSCASLFDFLVIF